MPFESPKFQPKLEEIPKQEEEEKLKAPEPELEEMDYKEQVEYETKKLKKEYGELAKEAGLSEKIFSEIEIRLEEEGDEFEKSEQKLEQEKKKEKKSLKKRIINKVIAVTTAGVIGLSAITGKAKAIEYPPKIGVVEYQESPELIKWVKELEKDVDFLADRVGPYLPSYLRSLEEIFHSDLANTEKVRKVISFLEEINSLIKSLVPERTEVEKIPIENFEKMGLSNEFVRKVLKETFPKSWVELNLGSLTYRDEFCKRNSEVLATCYDWGTYIKPEIKFWKGSQFESKYGTVPMFLETLAHELGHSTDWEWNNQIPVETRIWLLVNVAKRLESDDRYHSDLVESIKYKNKYLEWYKKCKEYWAEICLAYFMFPESKALPPQDRLLVKNYLKITDPDFDVKKAKERRDEIMREFLHE